MKLKTEDEISIAEENIKFLKRKKKTKPWEFMRHGEDRKNRHRERTNEGLVAFKPQLNRFLS